MAAAAAVILVALIYGRWWKGINSWVQSVIQHRKTYQVAEQFCVESAVLWFVFPILDSIYDPDRVGKPALWPAYLVALMFFIFALVLSHAAKED